MQGRDGAREDVRGLAGVKVRLVLYVMERERSHRLYIPFCWLAGWLRRLVRL